MHKLTILAGAIGALALLSACGDLPVDQTSTEPIARPAAVVDDMPSDLSGAICYTLDNFSLNTALDLIAESGLDAGFTLDETAVLTWDAIDDQCPWNADLFD